MSDFLRQLAGRELGLESGLRPRLPSRFETQARGEPVLALPAPHDGDDSESAATETPLHSSADAASHGNRSERSASPPAAPATSAMIVKVHEILRVDASSPASPAVSAATPPAPVRQPSLLPGHAATQPAQAIAAMPTPVAPAQSIARTRTSAPLYAPVEPRAAALSAAGHLYPRETDTRRIATPAPDVVQSAVVGSAPAPETAVLSPPRGADDALRPLPHATEPRLPAASETIVQVSIGRIEVRANTATPPAGRNDSTGRQRPGPATLQDYLRERSGGTSA